MNCSRLHSVQMALTVRSREFEGLKYCEILTVCQSFAIRCGLVNSLWGIRGG